MDRRDLMTRPSPTTVIGVDIGQRSDPTAYAVVEAVPDAAGPLYVVRAVGRLPLGTPYPSAADRLASLVRQIAERAGGHPLVYVDATGVGQPVVDLLVERGLRYVIPVYFSHGDRRERVRGGIVRLGKAWLVNRLVVLLETGRLRMPRTREVDELVTELFNYEVRIDDSANDTYGAFRVGTHDDLVTALGLAVQTEPALTCAPALTVPDASPSGAAQRLAQFRRRCAAREQQGAIITITSSDTPPWGRDQGGGIT